MACLSTLVPLCACLVSPHWLLCAHGLSLHTGSSVRAASLPHVQLGRAWLIPPSSYDARTGSCLLCIRGPSSIGRAPHKVCISVCGQVLNQYPHVPAYHRPSFDMRMTRLVWGVVQNQSLGGDGEATLEGRSHVSVEYLCILPANPAGVTKQYARTTRAICPHHESGVT